MLQYSYLCHDNKPDNKADNRKTGVLLSASFSILIGCINDFSYSRKPWGGINYRMDVLLAHLWKAVVSCLWNCCFLAWNCCFFYWKWLCQRLGTVVPPCWHGCVTTLAQLFYWYGTTTLISCHKQSERSKNAKRKRGYLNRRIYLWVMGWQ